MRWIYAITGICTLFAITGQAAAAEGEAPLISVFVAGPHPDDSDSLFGHAALFVDPPGDAPEIAYSYNVYAPEGSREWLPSASIGRAQQQLLAKDADALIASYESHGRETRRTPLDLTDDEARAVAARLETLAATEGRIPYDMIHDNCATRLRDVIDAAVGGALQEATGLHMGQTVKDIAVVYLDHRIVEGPIWGFLYGPSGDQDLLLWDSMFLPLEFERLLKTPISDGVGGSRVLAGETTILSASIHPAKEDIGIYLPSVAWMLEGTAIVLGALAVLGLRRNELVTRRVLAVGLAAVGLVVGAICVFMLVGWNGYFGAQMAHNQNVLVASLLAFLMVPASVTLWRSRTRGWRMMGRIASTSLLLVVVAALIRFLPSVPAQYNMPFIGVAAVAWSALLIVALEAVGVRLVFGQRLHQWMRRGVPAVDLDPDDAS